MLVAPVSSVEDLQSSFINVEGAVVDYSCGVVSSGKAIVFNGPDRRIIETVDLNTSASLNTPSVNYQCDTIILSLCCHLQMTGGPVQC